MEYNKHDSNRLLKMARDMWARRGNQEMVALYTRLIESKSKR